MSLDELEELERSETPVEDSAASRFVVRPVPEVADMKGGAAAVVIAEPEEKEVVVKGEVWVVYDYDHQTGQYSNPITAYTSEAAAMKHPGAGSWMGVHKLDVWKTVEDWEHAGKPIWKDW